MPRMKKNFQFGVILAILFGLTGCYQKRLNERASSNYNQGEKFYSNFQFEAARKEFAQAAEFDPESPLPHYALGNTYFMLGRFPEAIKAYEEAIAIYPEHPRFFMHLGQTYLEMNDYEKAEEVFRKLERDVAPKGGYAAVGFGMIALKKRNFEEAQQYFDRAMQNDPTLPDLHIALGRYNLSQNFLGNYDAAYTSFERANSSVSAPQNYFAMGAIKTILGQFGEAQVNYNTAHATPLPLDSIGYSLYQNMALARDEYDLALTEYTEMIGQLSNWELLYRQRANLYEILELEKRILPDLKTALALQPYSYDTMVAAIRYYLKRGNQDKAEELIQKAMDIYPYGPEAHVFLGDIKIQQGKLDEAVNEYQLALKYKAHDVEAHRGLYQAHLLLGQIDPAKQELAHTENEWRQNVLNNAYDVFSRVKLAEVLVFLGSFDQAYNELKQATELAPKNEAAFIALAHYYEMFGKFESAVDCYIKINQAQPSSSWVFQEYARLLLKKRKYGDAEREIHKALQINPENPENHFVLGDIYLEQRRLKLAQDEYNKVIKQNPRSALAYKKLGDTLQGLGLLSPSLAAYQTGLKIQPYLPELHSGLGELYARQGNRRDSEAEFEQAATLYNNILKVSSSSRYAMEGLIPIYKRFGQGRNVNRLMERLSVTYTNLPDALKTKSQRSREKRAN
jgi:superkiller protein 3